MLEKWLLSLAMTSVRPVNRMLELGIRGIAASDVALFIKSPCGSRTLARLAR